MQGLTTAVRQQLRRAGWAPMCTSVCSQQLLLSDYLASEPGAIVSAPRIDMELTLDAPDRVYLILQIGGCQKVAACNLHECAHNYRIIR